MNARQRRLSWPERLLWTADLIAFHVHTWVFTRRLGLLAQGVPALLLAVGFLVLWSGQGDGPDRDLISRYDLAVERALASDDLVSAKVYVRKLVLLDEPGPRTRYALARLAEHEGDLPRASRLMSDLAPCPGSGYPAAHFWVAKRLLDQQAPQVLLAAGPRFGAPKQGRKFLMEGGKAGRHALKLVQIHGLSSTMTKLLSWRLFYINNLSL